MAIHDARKALRRWVDEVQQAVPTDQGMIGRWREAIAHGRDEASDSLRTTEEFVEDNDPLADLTVRELADDLTSAAAAARGKRDYPQVESRLSVPDTRRVRLPRKTFRRLLTGFFQDSVASVRNVCVAAADPPCEWKSIRLTVADDAGHCLVTVEHVAPLTSGEIIDRFRESVGKRTINYEGTSHTGLWLLARYLRASFDGDLREPAVRHAGSHYIVRWAFALGPLC